MTSPQNSNNKNNNNKECYIDYQEGTIPIILSAPHGGTERPDHLPDRHASQGNLKGDRYTRELTLELADEIERILNVNINSYSTMNCSKQKLRVFRVSNRLHRSKVDVNRGALEQAVPIVTEKKTRAHQNTNTNQVHKLYHPEALHIYNEYHACLQRACDAVMTLAAATAPTYPSKSESPPNTNTCNDKEPNSKRESTNNNANKKLRHQKPRALALLLDIHGHAHPEGWIEIGHLIDRETLVKIKTDDKEFFFDDNAFFHPKLIRSDRSLGAFINKNQMDVDVVPSPDIPHPGDAGSYLMGGYITRCYRSRSAAIHVNSKSMNVNDNVNLMSSSCAGLSCSCLYTMQLELPPAVRMEDRCASVRWLALAIVQFMHDWGIVEE